MANTRFYERDGKFYEIVRTAPWKVDVFQQYTKENGDTWWGRLDADAQQQFFGSLALEASDLTVAKGRFLDQPPSEVARVFRVFKGDETLAVLYPSLEAMDQFLELVDGGQGEGEMIQVRFPHGYHIGPDKLVKDPYSILSVEADRKSGSFVKAG